MHGFLRVFRGDSRLRGCDNDLAALQRGIGEVVLARSAVLVCDAKAFKMSPRLCQQASEAASCAEQEELKRKRSAAFTCCISCVERMRLQAAGGSTPDAATLPSFSG